jgi:hypothetical protein
LQEGPIVQMIFARRREILAGPEFGPLSFDLRDFKIPSAFHSIVPQSKSIMPVP